MVVIRLMRMGAKKRPYYRVVVQDRRARKEGAYIEQVGKYNPVSKPKLIDLDRKKIESWVKKGAKLSPTVERLLKITTAGG